MDVDGLGEKLIDQLVNEGIIKNVDDLFRIQKKQLADLERMGGKSADNIIGSINKSKLTTFSRFIYALGIRHVGEHISKLLERTYEGDFDSFLTASYEDLESIEEIGPIVAQSIIDFWNDPSNKQIIDNCFELGVVFEQKNNIISQTLMGKIFVFTGSLEKFTRKDAQNLVEKVGGRVSNSVSSKTNFIIAGPGAGSKLNKAISLGIQVLSEEDFLTMMNENNG